MVEVNLETPLAGALNAAIGPKLLEVGWVNGGDDSALTEIILLMLANSKTEAEVSSELGDILSMSHDDPTVMAFSQWLFEQVELLNAQLNGAPANGGDASTGFPQDDTAAGGEMDTDMGANEVAELNAPTGPRSMRNGNMRGAGREKRMIGHISKAMDRPGDSALHRARGAGINTHRGAGRGAARGQRNVNNRAANLQNGFANMANMAAGGPQGANWMMPGGQPNQMDLMALMEHQNQMMMQLSQQLMSGGNNGGNNGGFNQNRRGGKSLFDRAQEPGHRGNRRGGHHQSRAHNNNDAPAAEGSGEGGDDVEMGGNRREATNPEDSVCKYNLRCTNKECKFAHQSPVAPPGTTVDMKDVCSFGAACKNRKCVGKHPSPAQKFAHQSEQDCKFFPNCQNPQCTFRHPSMPLCRNGADCTTEGCKFTHVKTKCRFNPCLNPHCAFAHEEGQQGGFKDKVWTSETGEDHVSERKFVDEGVPEEMVKAEGQDHPSPDVDVVV